MRVKDISCIACVSDTPDKDGFIIAHKGGVFENGYNFWEQEIMDVCAYLDDLMGDKDLPREVGLWVWGGEAQPYEDDATDYYGKWRRATIEDVKAFGLLEGGK